MRDAVSILLAKAKKDSRIQALIDDARSGNLTSDGIQELNEPPWLKNSLKYMIQSGRTHSLEELTAMIDPAIIWSDESDKTKYQVFRYHGPDMYIGDKFAAIIKSEDLILIKTDKLFVLRHAEKTFGSRDLSMLLKSVTRQDDMTIEDYKLRCRQETNKNHGGTVESSFDPDDRGLFKIRRFY